MAADEHFDVLIVGAGLSGIGAAYHLQKNLPGKRYAILEGRSAIGGTWDLFRYPGVRSDSDMFTLGYEFRPWRQAKAIADGPSIRSYVKETAEEYGIDKHIRFNHWVTDIAWSSDEACWTVTAQHNGALVRYSANFLWMCSGYYRYAEGYTPEFKGVDRYKGEIVHPQHWPENLDYEGKRVIVIGSGATAVTLIPSMADKAKHITMLQRTPTYMYSMPATSALANFLSRFLPKQWVYWLMRWQRIILQQFVYKSARANPKKASERLIEETRARLPEGFDVEKHFKPNYNPWEQRLCLVPDDDLFAAIRSGKASIVTDHIETFTEKGILLKSGQELEADIIVTATGLIMEMLGGARVFVDGRKVELGDTLTYKGFMFSGLPNLASVFGYLNASWTLRADLISEYVIRLLKFMDKRGYVSATPVNEDKSLKPQPLFDFSSGYLQRAISYLPKQGPAPWRHRQDYARDVMDLRFGRIDDGFLRFAEAPAAAARRPASQVAAE